MTRGEIRVRSVLMQALCVVVVAVLVVSEDVPPVLANPIPGIEGFEAAFDWLFASPVVSTSGDATTSGPVHSYTPSGTSQQEASDQTCSDLCTGNESCTAPYTLRRTLQSPSAAPDFFGSSVTGTPSGQVLVGALADSQAATWSGAAYLMDPTSGQVVESYANPVPEEMAVFGFSGAAGPGWVALGAFLADLPAIENAGAVYVFDEAGLPLSQLERPLGAPLGRGAVLAGEGTQLLIGSYGGGSVTLHDVTTGNVVATYVDPGSVPDFGRTAVAFAGDRVVIGSPQHEYQVGPGSVRIYDRATGTLLQTLAPPDPGTMGFGTAIAVRGARLAVGAPYGDPQAVYEYDLDTLAPVRTLTNPYPCAMGEFGMALAFAQGDLVVGASDSGLGVFPGAVFVYDDASGVLRQTIVNPDPALAGFGYRLTNVGHTIVAGAGGAAYVFTICGDGVVDRGEQCDDGNATTGDGCSDTCEHETPTSTTSTSTSSTTTSTTISVNRAPLADAGADQVVATGDTAELDGRASLDPERGTLQFQWTFTSVPADSSAMLLGSDTPTPSFVADRAGIYEATLTVTDPQNATGSAHVLVTALDGGSGIAINITEPAAESTVEGDRIRVAGTISGTGNVGVTVNGLVASVYAGQFVADKVPLSVGDNVITASANMIGGRAASTNITVHSNANPLPLALDSVPMSGVAPLTVEFSYGCGLATPLQTISVDYDGDGVYDISTADPDVALEHTYLTAGLFRARLRVVGADNEEAIAEQTVVIEDSTLRDGTLRGMWNSMNAALSSGATTNALTFLTQSARRRYAPVFDTLRSFMPGIVASYSPLAMLTLSSSVGEYALKRNIDGEDRLFFVYFVQDKDGVWRLAGM